MEQYNIWSLFTELDQFLFYFASQYPHWIYILVFVVIFCETGLVIMPFLPGDSFLFLLGTLAGAHLIDPWLTSLLIATAALCGDSLNFMVGRFFRGKISPHSRWIKRKHIEHTENFYEKYGGITLILARFTPIIRTYAPFVGGISGMKYRLFLSYNVVGAILWVGIFIPLGYILGNNEFVTDNISKVVLGIVFISIIPIAIGVLKNYFSKRKKEYKIVKTKKIGDKIVSDNDNEKI